MTVKNIYKTILEWLQVFVVVLGLFFILWGIGAFEVWKCHQFFPGASVAACLFFHN